MTVQRAVWLGILLLAAGNCRALVKDSPAVPPGPVVAAAADDAASRSAAQQVAKDYRAAVNAKGLDGGIPYLHPDELVRFQKLLIPILDQERQAGRRNLLNATFGREAEMTDVRLAEPDDFMRRFVRVAAARLDEAQTRFDRVEVVGTVTEGEVLHVLLREVTDQGGTQTQRLVVVSLRPSGRDWKVLLGADIEAMVAGLQGRSVGRDPADRRAQPIPEAPAPQPAGDMPPAARPPR
jgi:hypothetical protein